MVNKKIKPCPYCGNPYPSVGEIAPYCWEVICDLYECNMPYAFIGRTLEEAVAAWNDFCDNAPLWE